MEPMINCFICGEMIFSYEPITKYLLTDNGVVDVIEIAHAQCPSHHTEAKDTVCPSPPCLVPFSPLVENYRPLEKLQKKHSLNVSV